MFAILVRSSAVLLLGATATPVLSQTVVSGVVRLERGGPIANAAVQVQGTHGGVTTTEAGRYRLVVPNDGFATVDSLTLIARAIGFKAVTRKVAARPGSYTLDFELEPATLMLEGVVVTGIATDGGAPAVAQERAKSVVTGPGSSALESRAARPADALAPALAKTRGDRSRAGRGGDEAGGTGSESRSADGSGVGRRRSLASVLAFPYASHRKLVEPVGARGRTAVVRRVRIDARPRSSRRALDLGFLVDATGSMGDENGVPAE
jgi:hypothetical protein